MTIEKKNLVVGALIVSLMVNAYFFYSVVLAQVYRAGAQQGQNDTLAAMYSNAEKGPITLRSGEKSITLLKQENKK